ncbi:MAG: tRNA pseudouridine38-40 synthase [Pseudohongiellaceae bacterium]|jgi:tRNA pseudouridine38-40 synthase
MALQLSPYNYHLTTITLQYYQVIISYKGSNYFGWQDQGDGGEKPTVQFEILKALRTICHFADCIVAGASRTDGGVHAQGQVAKLSIPLLIDPAKLLLGLNSLLPSDIRVRSCSSCTKDFNPNKDCLSKKYRYYFTIEKVSVPALSDIVAHMPFLEQDTQQELPFQKRVSKACNAFIGEHDFYSFSTRDKSVNSSVRKISKLELFISNLSDFGTTVYYFEIEGTGFLKHMIRYIVAALLEVGKGKIDSNLIEAVLKNPSQDKICPKVKAKGLHLVEINYEE